MNNDLITTYFKVKQEIGLSFGKGIVWQNKESQSIFLEVFANKNFLAWEDLGELEKLVNSLKWEVKNFGIGVLPKDWRASFWLAKRLGLNWVSLGPIQDLDGIPHFNEESETKAKLVVELLQNQALPQIKKILNYTDLILLTEKQLTKLQALGVEIRHKNLRFLVKSS